MPQRVWSHRWYWNRLPNTAVTLAHTVPNGRADILRTVVVNNTSAGTTTFALYLNYAGAAATSRLLGPRSLPTATDLVLTELWIPLSAGDVLHVQAGAGSALMVYLGGYELLDV